MGGADFAACRAMWLPSYVGIEMPAQRDDAGLPQVAVCVDKSRNYGRKVLQGLADYAETVGRWSLYVDPEATGSYSVDWLENWHGDGILGTGNSC